VIGIDNGDGKVKKYRFPVW